MEFIKIFFMLLSVLVIVYLVHVFNSRKRLAMVVEFFFIGVYASVFVVFMFPQVLSVIEELLGIQSAINFILYLSIFVAYGFLFLLYKKSEEQRMEITKLSREIALKKK